MRQNRRCLPAPRCHLHAWAPHCYVDCFVIASPSLHATGPAVAFGSSYAAASWRQGRHRQQQVRVILQQFALPNLKVASILLCLAFVYGAHSAVMCLRLLLSTQPLPRCSCFPIVPRVHHAISCSLGPSLLSRLLPSLLSRLLRPSSSPPFSVGLAIAALLNNSCGQPTAAVQLTKRSRLDGVNKQVLLSTTHLRKGFEKGAKKCCT